MSRYKPYNIVQIFKEILQKLPGKNQIQFWLLLVAMSLAAGLETITLGGIAFFISAVTDPESVLQSAYVEQIQGFFNRQIFDNSRTLIIYLSAAVVVLVLAKNISKSIVLYYTRLYSAFVGTYLGERLLKGFLRLPLEWHLSRNSADLVLGVFWRIHFTILFGNTLQILSDILVILVLLSTLLIIEPVLSLSVFLVVGGSSFIIFSKVRIKLDQTVNKVKEYRLSINRDATKAMHGIKDVKVYGRKAFFENQYMEKAYKEARLDALQQVFGQLPEWILETVGFFMLVIAIYIMYFYIEFSSAKVTGLVALLAITAWRVLPAANKILGKLTQLRATLPYVQNNLDYLKAIDLNKVSITSKPENRKNIGFENKIEFENVSFAYQGTEAVILQNISFTIEKGKTVGVIGASGAGKSTLVDLLIGLLAPTSGRIIVDGKPFINSQSEAWIPMIGYVPQSPYICDGTLLENVAFGVNPDQVMREIVLNCCSMAAMDDFLSELPNGIDTKIGERGVKLSGGQRQRVAIARALYHLPEIMIFDEATSSLDTKSEKAIQNTIYSFKGKQTLIIIAHRLSTVEDCDELIWLEKGSIKCVGKPHEILNLYKKSFQEDKRSPCNKIL